MIFNFKQLLAEAKKREGIIVGVPSPEDESSIKTVINAREENLANFILTGNREKISDLLEKYGGRRADYEIISTQSEEESAAKIVEMVHQGKIQVILKGFLPTASLMKPILDKDKGLRTGNLLSDILVVENPADNYEGLLGMTDGGLNILPNLEQKKQIVENAVKVFHKLGYEKPKVGIMAAVETVKDSMPATLDADALTTMNREGQISGCEVYGPLALDIAVSPGAAKHKGIANPVAGMAEILVVPNIEAGNLLGKAYTYYLHLTVAHVIMGARIPILIPSRNESDVDKTHSVALGVICA
ncbi:MAG TPA: bifunctional enoyl-CoA hydratase/phosphate acetyltransferase [Candidatus Kapabacteria bacterium]|nr:bifunctional enoyl-CoA hydratase/phosphate acetyltransferase [Candidatus Kapabacteria bacterium]